MLGVKEGAKGVVVGCSRFWPPSDPRDEGSTDGAIDILLAPRNPDGADESPPTA